MDNTDHKLISALRHDARASLSDLAGLLGLSRATIRARIDKLRASGDILGFTVVLRDDAVRDPVRGLMMIGIDGRGTDRILRQLSGFPEVRGLYATNGRWDVIAELGAPTLEALDEVLSRIRRLDGIATSETSLLLSTRKSSRS
ncbi:Lrp/AsnC family transcriptional regulator [Puniceibacterium sp. IMCC21224]|uniref:Lrp/AsnC family transcriptional regulator n=1 Tax=Puniceibacterium sp. IMCC21224 TaxID=1618204 RepID=UPI00064DCC4B|nr:Lrp/AsnC family transcriptional regulator [Puniceibacterium sp. IMCC21224]KMK67134.1 transcriptional regulator, AsnC family [Puniceibacterium sp. IMCC21224]